MTAHFDLGMVTRYPPETGGLSDYSQELCKALSELGRRVAVVAYGVGTGGRDTRKDGDIMTFRCLNQGPLVAARLWREIESIKPDVIHLQSTVHLHPQQLYLFVLLKDSVPLVTSVHETTLSPRLFYISPFLELAYKRSNRIIVLTEYTRGLLNARLKGKVPIEVIPHGVDTNKYHPSDGSKPFRRRLGLGDDFVVLFVGYIRQSKGLEYLLRAFKAFRDRRSTGKLVIIGEPDQDSRNLSIADSCGTLMRNEIAKLGLGREIIVTGYAENRVVEEALREADVTVFPYIRSFQSGLLPKALSSGSATIVSKIGGLAEIVQGDVNALMVPPADSSRLGDALDRLYLDEALRKSLGAAAREFAEHSLSWPKIARRHLSVYEGAKG